MGDLRVHTFELGAGDFAGLTHDLVLPRDLNPNYLVMVVWGAGDTASAHDVGSSAVRVSADPFGTGDLAESGSPDTIQIARGAAAGDWYGVVIVVEDPLQVLFRLLDVVQVDVPGVAVASQTVAAYSRKAWSDRDRVSVLAGLGGGGCSHAASASSEWCRALVVAEPNSVDGIDVRRLAASSGALDTALTVVAYVHEWQPGATFERLAISGSSGAAGLASAASFTTQALTASRARARTMVLGSLVAAEDVAPDALQGVIALGDGVSQLAIENRVAVGRHAAATFDAVAHVISHPDMQVEWFASSADDGEVVAAPVVAETYDGDTDGDRLAVVYGALNDSGSTSWDDAFPWARHTSSTGCALTTRGGTVPHYVLQSIDLGAVESASRQSTSVIDRIVKAVDRIEADMAAIEADAAPLLNTGSASQSDLGAIAARLQGVIDSVDSVRSDLDSLQIETAALVGTAGNLIAGWRWERAVRRYLARLARKAAQVATDAAIASEGAQESTHTVRQGETWQSIAHKRLGAFSAWRTLQRYNGLRVDDLAPGVVLRIPRRVT